MSEKIETTSSKIRRMYKDGMSRSVIAKTLNIRYQHVRNVLVNDELKLKKNTEQLTLDLDK